MYVAILYTFIYIFIIQIVNCFWEKKIKTTVIILKMYRSRSRQNLAGAIDMTMLGTVRLQPCNTPHE